MPKPAAAVPEQPAARVCAVRGCDRPHEALGLCRAHYRRQRLYGDPTAAGEMGGPSHYPRALREAGLSKNRADHWCRMRYLEVPLSDTGRRQWTELEVRVALQMHRLTEIGFTVERAAEIARELVTTGRTRWALGSTVDLRIRESAADKAASKW